MKDSGQLNYQYIDTAAKLDTVANSLVQRKTVAVDLEADSMHHYKEKICLIQIATRKTCVIIDPLPIQDLSPLNSLFANPEIQKIFHGADYDVRSLYRDFSIRIRNLFDTELACRFLGIPETGLDAVLSKRFNVQLDKRFQKKDWSRRPLPKEMIDYAAGDVFYLIPLASQLQRELKAKGRLSWTQEECDLLRNVRPNSNNEEPLFLRFKGAGRLNPRSLTILEALLQMRDGIAQKKDRPWFKVLRNQALLNIAVAQSSNPEFLLNNRLLSSKEISRYAGVISRAINKALAVPEDCLLKYPYRSTPRVKPSARKRIGQLKQWRDDKAKILQLNPAMICNKMLLSIIAHENPKTTAELRMIEEIKDWQFQIFGDELLNALKG
jgi:ribonuclease D